MNKTNSVKTERIRRLVAVVAVLVTLYYLYWRVTGTLNRNAPVLAWSLWGAEVFGAITTFLFFFTVWRPVSRKPPEPPAGRKVDIFIPTLNESIPVLRTTLLACNDVAYPHRTLVLDDGGRAEVRSLCEELHCVYLARKDHHHAKAGNLNFGLENSDAEFIAVFDADHVPLPHFIDRLLGYFKDENLAFAQAPQEFYNIDSFQHRADYKRKYIWTEQNLFYSLIQPGRDRWNAAYFVGSCALMRRKALDDIGGFARESVTEDMLTSIRLHAKGWNSVYHKEHLAYGIAAETILPFHIQRVRWGLGGWQVFFRSNPLFIRGLTFSQRLCYLASLIYPFEGFQKFIFYVVPPITLFTGILPMNALDIQYLLHFVPYYTISMFAFNEMGRGFGGSLMLEQFSMGKFMTYMQTLGVFLLPKRARRFKVTPKGEGRAPRRLLVPQYTVILVSVTAIVWALVQLVFQLRNDEFIIAVNSLWALYNTGLGIAIIQYARQKISQRRSDFRIPDSVPVLFRDADGSGEPRLAVANNLTRDGLSIMYVGRIPLNRPLKLDILLPGRIIEVSGAAVHEKIVEAGENVICRSGFSFDEITVRRQDELSRYLFESAVGKFLRGYSNRYETWLERTFDAPKERTKRAGRTISHLPAILPEHGNGDSFGVIKNISATGFLFESQKKFKAGETLKVVTVLGEKTITLRGRVARILPGEPGAFTMNLAGIELSEPHSGDVDLLIGLAEKSGSLVTV